MATGNNLPGVDISTAPGCISPMYHDGETLQKAFTALAGVVANPDQALDVINALLNAGIFLREAVPTKEENNAEEGS